jgi:hypothetical protein
MDKVYPKELEMAYAIIAVDDMPSTYAKAIDKLNKPLWQPLIQHKIKAYEDNGT